ncbi:hypothetical protein PVAP13_2NG084784 [Panicum virgatum]|uniref:Uncharacterized protein n=1 Tax=Panicum virgatum TaxID=38727 RepID=A0A8T0VCS6_PANVG|nr:hypothetical protein PVAP13_2NG084784 [Panicum virgatum]
MLHDSDLCGQPCSKGTTQVSLAKRLMAPPRRAPPWPPRRDASNARPASHPGPPPAARPPPRASSRAGAASAMPPRAPRPGSHRGAATRGRRACATTTKPVRWAASRTRQATCGSLHSEGLFACSGHGVQHGHGVHARSAARARRGVGARPQHRGKGVGGREGGLAGERALEQEPALEQEQALDPFCVQKRKRKETGVEGEEI